MSSQRKNVILTLDGSWFSLDSSLLLSLKLSLSSDRRAAQSLIPNCFRDMGIKSPPSERNKRPIVVPSINSTAHEAHQWIVEQYQPGDKVFIFGFMTNAYMVIKVLARLLSQGNREDRSLHPSRTKIPIHCIGVVYDSHADDQRLIDKIMSGLPIEVHQVLSFETSRRNNVPDACAVLRDPSNGSTISKEIWFFERQIDITLVIIVEWLMFHTRDDIQSTRSLNYFNQPPKWRQYLGDIRPNTYEADEGTEVEPHGLKEYELRVHSHHALNLSEEHIHLHYTVWGGNSRSS
ncbi:hypothetical protein FRC12_015996 [Ceratobasidium sp. 428]|nr:hypothetical protein FRC12_015996 [Ceratobasidium sp. 428]